MLHFNFSRFANKLEALYYKRKILNFGHNHFLISQKKKTIKKWRFEIARKLINRNKKLKSVDYFTNKLQSSILYEMKKSIIEPSNNELKMKLNIKIKDKNKSVTLLMEEFNNHLLINNKSKLNTTQSSENYQRIKFINSGKNDSNNDIKIIVR